jgi:hypothetical protein
MFLELEFEELENAFDLELEQVTEISDGGYDRGYAEAMEETEAEATIQEDLLAQVSEALENKVSGYERGKKEGFAEALDKRTDLVATENGEYTPSEDSTGFKSVVVNVPSKVAQIVDRTVREITEEDLEGVTRIGDYAFCSSRLSSISIPSSVTSIGSFAFQNCASLKNVTIPSSVTSIGGNSFETCNNLPRIVIPNSVISIDGSAFLNCGILAEVIFEENSQLTTIGSYNFASCSKLTNITIPEGVTKIGNYALGNNYLMEWISLPSSLKEIGSYAMRSCHKMTTVTIKATTPPTLGTNALNNCKALEKIIVPIGCGDAYKAATNWSAHADIIVEGDV